MFLIKNVDTNNVSIVCTAFLNWVRGGQKVEPPHQNPLEWGGWKILPHNRDNQRMRGD